MIDNENKVKLELIRDGKGYHLKTNLYDFIKDAEEGILCTECLGEAFEPEQRFENPDGTSIIFNEDYFGNSRGTSTIPGPFAGECTENVW